MKKLIALVAFLWSLPVQALPTPLYSTTNPTIPFQATWTPAISGAGWIEMVYTPSTATVPTGEVAWSTPTTDPGALRILLSPSVGLWEAILDYANIPSTQVEAARLDLRKMWIFSGVGRQTHFVVTWGPTLDGTGAEEVQGAQRGGVDQPTTTAAGGTHVGSLTSMWVGKTVSGTSLASSMTVQYFAVGAGRIDPGDIRDLAAAHGGGAAKYVVCLGDSITAFYDGYHTRLQVDMGDVAAQNWGMSGDTAQQALQRFGGIYGPLVRSADYISVLIGTNNILRDGATAVSTEAVVKEIYGWASSRGSLVVINTPPAANNSFGWDHLAVQTIYNAWIIAQVFGVLGREDSYSLFNTASNGSFGNYPISTQWSYDGIHPTGRYTATPFPLANSDDTLGDAVWVAFGSPVVP